MGRIGKPQKSQKNKKIKSIDPFYVGDRKDRRTVQKDQRPHDDDSQEVPRKARRLLEAINDVGKISKKKRLKQRRFEEKHYVHPGMTKPMESVPQFKPRPGESNFRFMGRVERETQEVLHQAKLEDKFKMKFDKNEAGEVVVKKKGLSQRKKERQKERKQKKKSKKQEKALDKRLEFDELTDKVEFGDVVSQPPLITAKPRKSQKLEQKPGQRSLLLKEIMSGQFGGRASTKREVGGTVKRKQLTPAQQVSADQERQTAIDLYRQLKGKKQKNTDT